MTSKNFDGGATSNFLFIIFFLFCAAHPGVATLLDTSFNPGTGNNQGLVESAVQQPDGKILVCGNFTAFNGAPIGYVARLNTDGSVDPSFNSHPSYWVRHMALQPDGKIIIGGFFRAVGTESRNLIARLNSDGTLDPTFNPGTGAQGTLGVSITGNPDPFVFQVALQADGKIIITGNFTNYNGVGANGIARLNADGSLDTTFRYGSGLSTWGRSLLVQSNGQIMVTGWFTEYNGRGYNRMVRINPDGSADTSFNPYFGDKTAVYSVVQLPNGQYIATGHSLNDLGLFKKEMARLNADGSVDSSFVGATNDKVECVRLQRDGKILLSGYFSQMDGEPRNCVARLNPDGTLDRSFAANVDNYTWTILPLADGRIFICGGFFTVDGISRNGVARLFPASVPQIVSRTMSSGSFNLSVATESGKTYVMEFLNSLLQTNWSAGATVAGDGTVKSLTDSNLNSSNRFYRIRQY